MQGIATHTSNDLRGNIVIAAINPTAGEYDGDGAASSTKNVAEHMVAPGTDPIDMTSDLGLSRLQMIVSDESDSLNMLRVTANLDVAGQEIGQDLSSDLPATDVTGAPFDNTNPIIGAHQIDISDVKRKKRPVMWPWGLGLANGQS